MAASPALSDHIPQNLIDEIFFEMGDSFCGEDPECVNEFFNPDKEFAFCMKEILHDEYTKERLEGMLNYKNTNGDFSSSELESFDFYMEMLAWKGCVWIRSIKPLQPQIYQVQDEKNKSKTVDFL